MPQSTLPLRTKRNAGSGASVAGIRSQTLMRRAGEEPVFASRSRKVTVWPRFTVVGLALILSESFVATWWPAGTALAATAEWATSPVIPETYIAAPMLRTVTATRCRATAVRTMTDDTRLRIRIQGLGSGPMRRSEEAALAAWRLIGAFSGCPTNDRLTSGPFGPA